MQGSLYSIAEHRVPELISVLGCQPAGDVSHKPGGRPPLLSANLWWPVVAKLLIAYAAVPLVVVVTFFNHNFVNCKATCTLIWRLKIYEIKYNISLNDVHT